MKRSTIEGARLNLTRIFQIWPKSNFGKLLGRPKWGNLIIVYSLNIYHHNPTTSPILIYAFLLFWESIWPFGYFLIKRGQKLQNPLNESTIIIISHQLLPACSYGQCALREFIHTSKRTWPYNVADLLPLPAYFLPFFSASFVSHMRKVSWSVDNWPIHWL